MAALANEIKSVFVILNFDFKMCAAGKLARGGNDFADFVEAERVAFERGGTVGGFNTGAMTNGNFDFGENMLAANGIF